MAKKPRNRIMLAVVLGLELGLLVWGVFVFIDLVYTKHHKGLPNLVQLSAALGAMVFLYLLYLKKEQAQVEERVVGEKFRTGALLDALPAAALLLDAEGTVLAANSRAAQALGADELELPGGSIANLGVGEIGTRLAEGAAGSFVAPARDGRRLRCTVTPVGSAQGAEAVRLVILEPQAEPAAASRPSAPAAGPGVPRGAFETLAPLLERTGNHLASMASAARASSPHEESRAAQLAGVAVRLAQAARRIRLLREISLIGEGRLAASLRPEEFDYAELVRSAGERMRALFTATGVDLAVEAPRERLSVRADRERMELVLRDLLEVGLAMTSAGGRVALRAQALGGEVEVNVTDTGCGMSRTELDGLFAAEGSPPVQEAYTGGVRDGLHAAKEIIEASGGQLWAESAPGRGTRFSLRLPLA
jgi:signal transduction histidine kinase